MDMRVTRRAKVAGKADRLAINFSDVFAGCGGLSLGLTNAGWRGCFAIEKNSEAFGTLKANLIAGRRRRFSWPDWLPQEAISTKGLLEGYRSHLENLKGTVTLLAGGPPCQGFSLAGRRTQADPRNSLVNDYIEIVSILEPRLLVIENVQGFQLPFKKNADCGNGDVPYSQRVREQLEGIGYRVFTELVDLSGFGVPQTRRRFILIAIRNDDVALRKLGKGTPFDLLRRQRKHFLAGKKLPTERPITVKEAIGDLETSGKALEENNETKFKGFTQICYRKGSFQSPFIKLLRKQAPEVLNSLRLPRHNNTTVGQFERIMATCKPGQTIGDIDRKRLGIKKQALTPLAANAPAATITTLPDDIVHYSEPRILTVRENARIQTFPDWFKFSGKYTTGGKARKNDCPRYTQVGNAVPPLFAEALGRVLKYLVSA